MSKYKEGDKFIIEIGKVLVPECMDDMPFGGEGLLYQIKGFNSLVFDAFGLDRLEHINEPEKFNIGDEVRVENIYDGYIFGIVTADIDADHIAILMGNGSGIIAEKKKAKKTGRTFPRLDDILLEMRGF